MDGAVESVFGEQAKYRFKECRKFRLAHLATTHGEFAVTNAAEATDIPIDHDVVWRIGEHEFRLGGFEQAIVGGVVPGVPAQQAMGTEQPQISGLRDRATG